MRDDPRVERLIRSGQRSRWILLGLALVLPTALHLLFARQARRLEALGDHGFVGEAVLVRATDSIAYYEYDVDGVHYEWNVARSEAPYEVGTRFQIVFLPEDPALSRPGDDTARGAAEAPSNRAFAWKAEGGVFAFFAVFFVIGELRLRELRERGAEALTDPAAYKRRVGQSLAVLAPLIVMIVGWNVADAKRKGESVWPIVIGTTLAVGVLFGTMLYVARRGPQEAASRSSRILRIAGPLAAGVALLRLVVWLASRP
jgi:hypothetical protein